MTIRRALLQFTRFVGARRTVSCWSVTPPSYTVRLKMSREVLAPPLLHLEPNRCYRINLVHEDFSEQRAAMEAQQPGASAQQGYTEEDLYGADCDDDDEDESEYVIEELADSVFKLSMHVAPAFFGGLVGHKSATKRRIESETQTEVTVPRAREGAAGSTQFVTIEGKSRDSVMAARRRINLLLASLRKRIRATHFYGVALNFGEIKEKFCELKKEILAADLPGIEEELFQRESSIHLTLGTCVLLDNKERAKAVEVLNSCRQYLSGCKVPFEVHVSGLEIMNDDPSAARVLYARVEAPDLQVFGDAVLKAFTKSGLGSEEFGRDTVKLHMTIMKRRYQRKAKSQKAHSFDVREILKRFGDFDFGSAQCSEVVLCVIGSSQQVKEFYKITGTLKLQPDEPPHEEADPTNKEKLKLQPDEPPHEEADPTNKEKLKLQPDEPPHEEEDPVKKEN